MNRSKLERGKFNRRKLNRTGDVLLVLLAVVCLTAQAQNSEPKLAAAATRKDGKVPRTAWDKPDFTGFYDLQYTPNMAFGKEETVPYTDAGRAAYQNHDAKDDPTSNCWFPGVPRIMQSPYPTQWAQTPTHLLIMFEYMHMFRSIPLDGRAHPAGMEPAFMGDSVGHWEGDTVVVDTTGFKGGHWTWLDTAGHQHTENIHVTERFTRTAGNIRYQYTVEDPKFYAKPWTLERTFTPLKMTPGLPDLIEYNCDENNKDLQHLISTKPALPAK